MQITHILRGEDHIPNTPKQILIQEALNFERPQYAHLPIILGTDRSKLSKRQGAVGITEYRRQGYLPEAIINFIAFLAVVLFLYCFVLLQYLGITILLTYFFSQPGMF